MSEFEGISEENQTGRPYRGHGVQFFGRWMIIAGILAAVVGLLAQLLVAARANPRLVNADRMPVADFGLVIVGVAAGIILVLFGGLILAVRWPRLP